MQMIKVPCKNCDKRIPGCHGGCKEYKEYKGKMNERQRLERDARAFDHPDIYREYAPYRATLNEKRGKE